MDVALVAFMAGYVFTGWRSGLLHRLIGLGFLAISFVASAYLRYPIGAIATTFLKNVPVDYANLVGYAIAFPAILATLHIASHFILGRVRFEGLAKEIDQALGAVFGGVEAILIISAVVVIFDAYFGTSSSLRQTVGPGFIKSFAAALNGSTTVQLLRGTTVPFVLAVLGPLLPKDVTTLLPGGVPSGLRVLPGGLPGGLPFPSP